jgi:5-methylcytosine-specific restriction enzyme subunit McrC
MADIPSSSQITQDLAKWRTTRLMSHYKQVKPWCELIVKKLTPMSVMGNWHGLSLLYPMNMLFEKYVATWLSQNVKAGTEFIYQASSEYLTLHNNSKMFNLKPDFLLTAGNKKWVLDAKWKLLDQNKTNTDDDTKYKLSPDDFYQLFAYGHKYLAQQDSQELFLIYPQCKTFNKALPVFDYGKGMNLWVMPFDLKNNKLLDVGGKTLPLLAT